MYKHQYWMKDLDHSTSYWGSNGTYQAQADVLSAEVPSVGEAKNPIIEVIRNMQNFYYDRYNNGHCNPCRTQCAAPVRRFMKKHKAPSNLKFKISVRDSELEESMDWVIAKAYELFTGEEVKKMIVPQYGEMVEMNDGSLVGVLNHEFIQDGNDLLFHAFMSPMNEWLKCSEIKRVVPFDEIPSGN
jgi:hypothetical protein